MGAFEFVVAASLRAEQLMRGCTPRIVAAHKHTVMAQHEVALGRVAFTTEAATVPDRR